MPKSTVRYYIDVDETGAVTGSGRAEDALKGVEKQAKLTGTASIALGNILANAATQGAAFLKRMGVQSVQTGIEFEASMSRVGAIADATNAEFTSLGTTARALGAATIFSASEAADGMSFLAMAGFETNEIIQTMPGLLDLAAAGQLDLASAADITSNILRGYNMHASEAGRLSDILSKTATSANTNVQLLGETMKMAGPVLSSFGFSIEEASAAAGLLANAGIQGSMAGTQLRSSILHLINPSGEAQKIMEALGISVVDEAGHMKSLADILDNVRQSTDHLTAAQRGQVLGQLVGIQAVSGFTALLQAGGDSLRGFTEELENAEGTAARLSQQMTDNLSGDLKELSSAAEEVQLMLYEVFGPTFRTMVQSTTEIVRDFANVIAFVEGNIDTLLPLLAGAGSALIALELYHRRAAIAAALQDLWTRRAAIGMALLQTASTMGVAALGALIGILATNAAAWEGFKTLMSGVWELLKEFFRSTPAVALNSFLLLSEIISTPFITLNEFVQNIFKNITASFSAFVRGLSAALRGDFTTAWDELKTIGSQIGADFVDALAGQVGRINERINALAGSADYSTAAAMMAEGGKQLAAAVVDSFKFDKPLQVEAELSDSFIDDDGNLVMPDPPVLEIEIDIPELTDADFDFTPILNAADVISELNNELLQYGDISAALGRQSSDITHAMQATEQAIVQLVQNGYSLQSAQVKGLIELYKQYAKVQETQTALMHTLMGAQIQDVRDLGNAVREEIQSAIEARIAETIAVQISKIIAEIPFPVNLAIAAGAGAAVKLLFNQIPSFRTGVDDFGGGIAKVHKDELITYLPAGANVITNANTGRIERALQLNAMGNAPVSGMSVASSDIAAIAEAVRRGMEEAKVTADVTFTDFDEGYSDYKDFKRRIGN